MKKGKLIKILATSVMGIMALAMPFSFAGCEEGVPDSSTQTIKTDAEAYVMLRDYVENYTVVNKDNSHRILANMGQDEKKSVDFSKSNLSDELVDYLKTNINLQDERNLYNISEEICFNLNDNSGYKFQQRYDIMNLANKTQFLNITKNVNNEYLNYSFDDNQVLVSSKVDADYAKFIYGFTESDLENSAKEVYDFWISLLDYDSYEKYVQNRQSTAVKIINNSMNLDVAEEDTNINIDLDYKGNRYVFEAVLICDELASKNSLGTSTFDIFAKVNIEFNDIGIVSLKASMVVTKNDEEPSTTYTVYDPENHTHVTAEDKVLITNTYRTHFLIDYDAELNNEEFIMNILNVEDLHANEEIASKEKITITVMDKNTSKEIAKINTYQDELVNFNSYLLPKYGHSLSLFNDKGEAIRTKTSFTSDTIVYLVYEPNKYFMKFHTNGGTYVEPKLVVYGTTITLDQVTIKDGFTLAGWYTNPDNEEDLYLVGSLILMPANDINLYAKWVPVEE